jgi:hypothetical protein
LTKRSLLSRHLVAGVDHLEVAADEDVVRPVDADVVHLVVAIAASTAAAAPIAIGLLRIRENMGLEIGSAGLEG